MIDILILLSTAAVWLSAFVVTLYIVTNMDIYEWNVCYLLEAVIDYHNNEIKIMEKFR